MFITHHDKPHAEISVDPPLISDHSLVVATYNVSTAAPSVRPRVCRRKWKSFNIDSFTDDLLSTDLVNNLPDDNVDTFFSCYDDTLATLLEKHAPSVIVTKYRPASPWFDTE